VDRFALDWAIGRNIPHGGWCPKDRRAVDGTIPLHYTLQETPSRNYKIRTRLNVVDSDATLILTPCKELTSGSLLTRSYALNNGKPCLHLFPADQWRDLLKTFVQDRKIKLLNVAGPREANDIEQFVFAVLDEFLAAFTPSSQS
jgi:hypothetical protein